VNAGVARFSSSEGSEFSSEDVVKVLEGCKWLGGALIPFGEGDGGEERFERVEWPTG